MNFVKKIACFLLLLTASKCSLAQNATDTTGGKGINIIHADKYNFQNRDSAGQFVSLVGHAIVQQGKTIFYADSMVVDQKTNVIEAFGNIHINDADSVQIYSDYLKYLGKEKKAFLNKHVKLSDGKGILTTDILEYDTQTKIGTYFKGGKVVNGKTTLTSTEGYYYGETRDVYFKKKVVLIDPQNKVYTDTLLYNTNTNIATFVVPTTIYNGKSKIITSDGFYDLNKKKAELHKRAIIEDSTYTFTADDISINDSTHLGSYRGHAIYRSKDSVGGFDLTAGIIMDNRKTNSFLAIDSPVLYIKQQGDTILIGADTLRSERLSELMKTTFVPFIRDTTKGKYHIGTDSSGDRYFQAYSHVKVFSDSLQAIGDSMFYSLRDSVFRLFKHPIAWAEGNQITGDTIYLFTQNKKPERLYVFENAMAISDVGGGFFNQVRGTTINGYFTNGKISFLRTKGSPAENVYYAQDDDKKFVGVNQSASDVINAYFENSKPQKVVFVNNLNGVMSPMRQVDHKAIRVRKFEWLEEKRPKSRNDILPGK